MQIVGVTSHDGARQKCDDAGRDHDTLGPRREQEPNILNQSRHTFQMVLIHIFSSRSCSSSLWCLPPCSSHSCLDHQERYHPFAPPCFGRHSRSSSFHLSLCVCVCAWLCLFFIHSFLCRLAQQNAWYLSPFVNLCPSLSLSLPPLSLIGTTLHDYR